MSTTPNNDAPASEALAAKSQQSGISGRMLAIFYLIAIVLGIVNGIWGSSATQSFADFIATMFIRLFKFVAIPIIAVSIISTLSSISKSRSSGRIFRHTIFYTLFTTILAATLAALLYEVFSPENVSASISGAAAAPLSSVANAGGAGYLKYIESVIPDNILAPFLSANVCRHCACPNEALQGTGNLGQSFRRPAGSPLSHCELDHQGTADRHIRIFLRAGC